jgi:nucleoside-diphosphate-sugar epimerase
MRVFITGGVGFIGINLADHHLRAGHEVTIFDDLSRDGTASNMRWLRERHGDVRGRGGRAGPSARSDEGDRLRSAPGHGSTGAGRAGP